MDPVSLQASVAEKIKALYAISRELEQLFPGRHYTPDGHMVGSIGEALAASCYGLELFTAGAETHDAKAPDEAVAIVRKMSEQLHLPMVEIDSILWSYCASHYGEICTAAPHCEACVVRGFCTRKEG